MVAIIVSVAVVIVAGLFLIMRHDKKKAQEWRNDFEVRAEREESARAYDWMEDLE